MKVIEEKGGDKASADKFARSLLAKNPSRVKEFCGTFFVQNFWREPPEIWNLDLNSNPSSCYRGPEPPKWLGEGAEGFLASWWNGLPRVSSNNATPLCTNATGLWSTYTKTPFAPAPKHFEASGACRRHLASQGLNRVHTKGVMQQHAS